MHNGFNFSITSVPFAIFWVFFFFLTIDILKDVKYLIMILIFIFLMISDTDHLLMCLFVYLHIVFGEKFFKSFAHFWTGFLFYCWVWRILYIFWIIIPFQIWDLQIFCPIVCCLCLLNLEMIVNFWAPTLHLWFEVTTLHFLIRISEEESLQAIWM